MQQVQSEKKQLKDKGEIPTVTVHMGKIIKLKHYVYPQNNSKGRPYHRIINLDTLIIFYLVQRRHLFTLNN